MTSPLARIESHSQEAKRLIGINYKQFVALVVLGEQRHIEKQAEIEKNKIRIMVRCLAGIWLRLFSKLCT